MIGNEKIPWKRLTVEAAAIVGSILLAFAIDAWWEDSKEQNAEVDQLLRVLAELEINADIIEQKLGTISTAITATSEFMSWMGPEPEPVQSEVFFDRWTTLYSIGFFALTRSAAENYLAAGQIASARNVDVRNAISNWYSDTEALEGQYAVLRVAHADLGEQLRASVPTLHLDSKNPVMEDHPKSKFPFVQADLLSNSQVESQFGLYLIRLEFFKAEARDILNSQAELLDLIGSTTSK
jgi:hypothetical protein